MVRVKGMDHSDDPLSDAEKKALSETPRATPEELQRERDRVAMNGRKFRASQQDRSNQARGESGR